MFPWYCQKIYYLAEIAIFDIASVKSYISGAFQGFLPHDISSAIGFIMIPWRILLKNTHSITDGDCPSEQTLVYVGTFCRKKRLRRNCQRKCKNTRSESDKLLMKEQRNRYNNPLNYTKKDYIKTKIENPQCPKDLYEICDKLLNPEQKSVLPLHDCTVSFG